MIDYMITVITICLCNIVDTVGRIVMVTLVSIISVLGIFAIELWLPAVLTASILFLMDELTLANFIEITLLSRLALYGINMLINKKL